MDQSCDVGRVADVRAAGDSEERKRSSFPTCRVGVGDKDTSSQAFTPAAEESQASD